MRQVLHGSAVAFESDQGLFGLLILGKSGAGKSELALELISLGAKLIADDQTDLRRDGEVARLFVPPALRGLIELRGLGILSLDFVESVPLVAVVDLDEVETQRLPERHVMSILGLNVARLRASSSRAFAFGLKHYVMSQQWRAQKV